MIREGIKKVQTQQIAEDTLLALMVLEELNVNNLNENLNEGVNDILKKFGLELEKKSPGVIEYIMKFSKGVGQFIYYAVKGDKEKIKELMVKFKKEDFVDFLMKLDMMTLHMVTGPIHFINAVTGWDLEAKIQHIKDKAGDVADSIKNILSKLKSEISNFFDAKLQPIAIKKVNDIESLIGG